MPLEQMRSVKKLCLIARKKILEIFFLEISILICEIDFCDSKQTFQSFLNMKSDFPTHQKQLNRKIKISAGILAKHYK